MSEIRYSQNLVGRLSEALGGTLRPKTTPLPHIEGAEQDDRRFGQRIAPVETFIGRVAKLAAPVTDEAFVFQRDIVEGPPPFHRLSFSFNESSYSVMDPFALRHAFPAGAHANNLSFQASIANAVPAFAAAIVEADVPPVSHPAITRVLW